MRDREEVRVLEVLAARAAEREVDAHRAHHGVGADLLGHGRPGLGGEVLGQAGTHRLDHMTDRFDVIETGDPDQNVRMGKLVNLRFRFRCQGRGMDYVRKMGARRHTFIPHASALATLL